MLKVYITNLGKYNEGELIGEWITLPIDDEELEEVYTRIGINEYYEETFITDYESDIDGVEIHEYSNISELNEVAEMLEDLEDYELEIIGALLSEGYDFEEALNMKDDVIVYNDCSDMEDVAIEYCEMCGVLDQIPDHLQAYFDTKKGERTMLNTIKGVGTYIFIRTHDHNASDVCEHVRWRLPIDVALMIEDHGIILNVPREGCGYSLNELKATISQVADADVVIGDVYSDGTVERYEIN